MSKRDLFWCDHCAKKCVDGNGNDTLNWYGCYISRDYSKHKKTKKHIASLAKDERDEISITCNKCNEKFSEEGFANHEKRNKELWGFHKIGMLKGMTCNNFTEDKKRYGSMKEVRSSRDSKPKQKRVKVGKLSPITGLVRQKNKPNNFVETYDEDYYICKTCSHMVNDTTLKYSDNELMNKVNKIMCLCKSLDNNIKMDIEDKVTIKCNDDELTEDDYVLIDKYGSKLYFEDYCDTCLLPINYDYNDTIINHLDIDTCCCD